MKPSLSVLRTTCAVRGPIRVLVVDDSVVMRHLLQQALKQDPGIEVVGCASNGAAALAQIPDLQPDLVTLDIEMPEMDGLETLRRIRAGYPRLRTIMFSTLTVKGGAATFEALSLGADDYVEKASNAGSLDKSLASLRLQLIPKIKQFFTPPGGATATPAVAEPKVTSMVAIPRMKAVATPKIVAIGVSTGGPQALASLISKIPPTFPLPILIVQHMPATFTRLLAERLQALSLLKVQEATAGAAITPGSVFVAPGNYHLRAVKAGSAYVTALDQEPHENSCRPSVDVMFRSVAEQYGASAIYVILTGMGSDGLHGARALRTAGAWGIAQDEASSVVWGMPGAVVKAGLADSVLPLDHIAPELIRRTAGSTHGHH